MILDFFIILVASEGGTNVDRELRDDDIVNSVGEGSKAVKDCDFVGHERGAGIVNRDNLQDAMVDGVAFFQRSHTP